jgi:3',5'-cyclic AMP phosphodiesterase CpdA
MERIAKLVQASDFHFVPRLTHEKRAFYERHLRAGCHSFSKLVGLAREVDALQFQDGKYDALLMTGDLSTDGSPDSFTTGLSYIQGKVLAAGRPALALTLGLDATPNRRLLLPGNHDRWDRSWFGFQRQGAVFENVLKLDLPRPNYPYVKGLRSENLPNASEQPAVLFFVFDSTPGVLARFWPWDRLARGRIDEGARDHFFKIARDINQAGSSGVVSDFLGNPLNVTYSNCVRIALLHHHPFDRRSTTLMENNEEFVDVCVRAGMHLVLFGHDHKEFWVPKHGRSVITGDNNHQTIFFCCPSASEYRSEQGFYSFDLDCGGFRFTFYKWKDRQFTAGGLDENSRFLPGGPQRFYFNRRLVHGIPGLPEC